MFWAEMFWLAASKNPALTTLQFLPSVFREAHALPGDGDSKEGPLSALLYVF